MPRLASALLSNGGADRGRGARFKLPSGPKAKPYRAVHHVLDTWPLRAYKRDGRTKRSGWLSRRKKEEVRGDRREAFEQLCRDEYAALVRTAYLITGDREEALDLAQEALARAY